MKRIYSIIVGLLLCITPFCVDTYSLYRLIAITIGMFIIIITYATYKKKNIIFLLILPILLVGVTYMIDHILAMKLNHVPIYAYEVKSSDEVSTYNSFSYRIYDCGQKRIFDNGYKLEYMCSKDALKTIDINAFLKDPEEAFHKNKEKFVKIKGKISKISGKDLIELSPYEENIDALNGVVKFDANISLRIKTFNDLSAYRIYDDFLVIGQVEKIEREKEKVIIHLTDTVYYSGEDYQTFTYEVEPMDTLEVKEYMKNKEYYLYGLNNIYLKYKNFSKYELSYVLTDERIFLEDILDDAKKRDITKENEVIATIYEKEDFDIIKCINNKVYFTKKNISGNDNLCN